jgi:uncharacterized protein (TIGR03083 family)
MWTATTVGVVNAPLEPLHDPDWYLDHFTAEAERFATAVETGPLDAEIPSCPGWDVARLAEHLGQIHRWASFCATNTRPPSQEEALALESFDRDHAADWYRDCAREVAATLRGLAPDAPTWHPFPVERVARVWPRRQAHETAMHRWDAERAIGEPAPFDPELASDGIDEYFEIAIPRLIKREQLSIPSGSLHVHCTDVDGEWLVWNEDGEYRVKRAHEKGDAALRGPAEAILLRLWGRTSELSDDLSPVGDDAVLAAWLSIAGM